MPLKVWLPLIQNNSNQGLMDLTPTNLGNVSFISGGKFGNCLSAGTGAQVTNGVSYPTNLVNELGTKFSCSIWVKPLGNHIHYSGTFISSGNWNVKCWAFGVNQDNSEVDVFSRGYRKYITCSVPTNTWTHLCCTSDNGLVKLYKNGEYVGERTEYATLDSDASNFCVGRETYANGYFSFNGNITDVRIYDEVLSLKQIKLLSQGLVAHYQLNDPYSTSNLIPNGNGNDGRLGWLSATYMSTTEIPPNQNVIMASFYSNNETTTYIPISQTTTYTLSIWLKAMQATGTTYPSIKPYDADKKIIMYYNSAEGFGQAYKTTLAQPLHKGDTVIYATDLSAWTTADNYYNYCAIFGYRDSFGRLYPDMGYTADSPQFAAKGSTKTNIDKTNNTITLNSAFTGEDRPAGTMICQATAGNTWIYPLSSINLTTIQDWTQKTTTINPITQPRLRYAKYINYLAYSGAYHAGITLTDDNSEQLIYDSSGHNYHGTPTSGLIISADTPRNRYSTLFPYSDQYVRIPNLYSAGYADTYTFSWWAKLPTVTNSTMMWGYQDGNRLNIYMYTGNCYWNTGDGTSNPFGVAPSAWADGNFHHFAVTGDGTTTKLYVDGEFKANAKTYKGITGKVIFFNGWDTGANYKFNGYLSDFRLYATCLSADDIKQLYDTPVSIANNGTMFTQGEFVEG